MVEYDGGEQWEVDLKSISSYRSSTSKREVPVSTTEKAPKAKRHKTNSSNSSNSSISSSSSSSSTSTSSQPRVPTLPVRLQRRVAVLGSGRVIETAVQDLYRGVSNAANGWIDPCFATIKHHYPSTTSWKLYLTCRSVSDASKVELIVALATIRINEMEDEEVADVNEKMKQKNGGVYFKKRE